ncbi:MAG: hypothetical protein ACUVSM_13310, partial [Armatimonadota bacterium]
THPTVVEPSGAAGRVETTFSQCVVSIRVPAARYSTGVGEDGSAFGRPWDAGASGGCHSPLPQTRAV